MSKKDFFKKNLILSMSLGALVILFGVFVMMQGETFLSLALFLFGIASIIKGIKELIILNNFAGHKSTQGVSIVSSIINIIIGVIVIYYHNGTVEFITSVILYLLAGQLLISSIADMFSFYVLIREKTVGAKSRIVVFVIKVIVSMIFIFYPMQVVSFIFKLIGALIIVYGLFLFFWSFSLRKAEKKFKEQTVEGESEVVE